MTTASIDRRGGDNNNNDVDDYDEQQQILLEMKRRSKSECLRCTQMNRSFSNYHLRDEKYIKSSNISDVLISSNPGLKQTQVSFAFELPYVKSMSMGPVTEFIYSCLLHSMSHDYQFTSFQETIESFGGTVHCSNDTFMLFFQYTLPLDLSDSQLQLCYNDMQERLFKPGLLQNQKFDSLTPHLKSKISDQSDVWNQFIFTNILTKEHSSNGRFGLPDTSKSNNLNKTANLDLWNEAYNLSLELRNSRLISIFQTKLELKDAEFMYMNVFQNFLDKQQSSNDFTDPDYMYEVKKNQNFVVSNDKSKCDMIFFTYFIPINRFSCGTITNKFYSHLLKSPELKEQLAKIHCYVIDSDSACFVNILGVLHRVFTIKVKSLSRISSIETAQQTVYTGLMNFFESLMKSKDALDKYMVDFHQNMCSAKYDAHLVDAFESSQEFLACRVMDHQIQDHVNVMYSYSDKEEFHAKISNFLVFITSQNCLSSIFTEASNCDKLRFDHTFPIVFEPFSSSKFQKLHNDIFRISVPFEFHHDDLIYATSGPYSQHSHYKTIDKLTPYSYLLAENSQFRIFELRNNYNSLKNYLSVQMITNNEFDIDKRWNSLLFNIIKNSLILFNIRHRIFDVSSNSTLEIFENPRGINIIIGSCPDLESVNLAKVFYLLDSSTNFINSNSDFFNAVLNDTIAYYESCMPDVDYVNDLFATMIDQNSFDTQTILDFLTFLKEKSNQKHLLIYATAFLTTSIIHLTLSTPFNVSPFAEYPLLSNNCVTLLESFQQSRAFAKNTVLIQKYRFHDRFSKFFNTNNSQHALIDESLTKEKIFKHFLLARNTGVNTIALVHKQCVWHKVALLYQILVKDLDPIDDNSLKVNLEFLEKQLKSGLEKYMRSLSDMPGDLRIQKYSTEVFYFDEIFISLQIDFDSRKFTSGAEYIMKKVGMFISSFKLSEAHKTQFTSVISNKLQAYNSNSSPTDIFNDVCQRLLYSKVKLNKPTPFSWLTTKALLQHTLVDNILSKNAQVSHETANNLLKKLKLRTIYQQQGLTPPSKLVYFEENYDALEPNTHIPGKDNDNSENSDYDNMLYINEELKYLEQHGPLNVRFVAEKDNQNENRESAANKSLQCHVEKTIWEIIRGIGKQ
ncbi:MAG: hypothetical protein MHMPM18_000113 [Marteilia pararefringens]